MEDHPSSASSKGSSSARQRGTVEFDRLIIEARAGSSAALDRLIEKLSEELWADLVSRQRTISKAPHGSSDLVQDTLIRVRQQFDKFERDTFLDFTQWARAVLYRRRLEWARNQKTQDSVRHKQVLLDLIRSRTTVSPGDAAHVVAVERQEDLERVFRIFELLKPNEQFVIGLRLFKGLSYPEIATMTELSEEAARKAYDRAVSKLRRKFDTHEQC